MDKAKLKVKVNWGSAFIDFSRTFFKRNIYAYIGVFFLAVFFLNLTNEQQNELLNTYQYHIVIVGLYIMIAYSLDINPSWRDTPYIVASARKETVEKKDKREEMTEKVLESTAIHEAAHFIALLKVDFEKYEKIELKIDILETNWKVNEFNKDIEINLYYKAFRSYIAHVAERIYNINSGEDFLTQKDSIDFDNHVRKYLYKTDKGWFIDPKNDLELNHNIKLMNEVKKQIEKECEDLIKRNEGFLFEVVEILKKRDILTEEAKRLLKQNS
jgi:hypothetical protein